MKDYKSEMLLIGKRIRSIRELKKYTREYMAEEVGISSKYLYEIETEGKDFSARILYNISHSLGVSMNFIMDGKCEKSFSDEQKLNLLKMIKECEL